MTSHIETDSPNVSIDFRWTTAGRAGARDGDRERIAAAIADMHALEAGAIANPDEERQVGHYWLRSPAHAPTAAQADAIRDARAQVARLVAELDGRFPTVLSVGIGGSALGPQLVSAALSTHDAPRRLIFVDNTDPEGVARAIRDAGDLAQVLTLVISKSGGTPETRNGYLLVRAAYERAGLDFAAHAIAVTGEGSKLDREADGWIARLPMWDWVGGRTSVTSAVGLLPAALEGVDVDAFIEGARLMDAATRRDDPDENPAMLLALAWHDATEGQARRAMVALPYCDRLALLSRYLQQLIMESIGKRADLKGEDVHQGLTVYGNKGSTDQHAYVQQLRDGPDDHFALFVEVLEDVADTLHVDDGVTAGDYLSGFLAGTRDALAEAGHASITITIPRVDAAHLGALIALFERAVGFYASFVGVNAYHQPGVEAGKAAANDVLALQRRIVGALVGGESGTASQIAARLDADERRVFHILRHLAANGRAHAEGSGLDRIFR